MRFRDRTDAGRRLADRLREYRGGNTLVLGLPRGGVPVAYEVARALDAPLDIVVARKLGAPHNPEFGMGAIAPGGVRVLDADVVNALRVTPGQVEAVVEEETLEMERRLRRYRGDRAPPDLAGRTVILVDDGIATGGTVRAALRSVSAQGPERVILAVPVAPPDTVEALEDEADEVVALETPRDFRAVGIWYERFDQTSDEEVIDLLEKARQQQPAPERRS